MFDANVLKVMIASPGDVSAERKVVTEEIHRWNDANASARRLVLLPVKWETHSTPQMGGAPQDIINRQLLEDADILIGIFGTRIGTPTSEYVSGTVEEIKKHVAGGRTAKVYFSDVPIPPSELNGPQYALVQQFKDECRTSGLYATFGSIQDFARDFRHHLDIELNQPRYLWLSVPDVRQREAPLSDDALRLLKAAAASQDGIVILQESFNGVGLRIEEEEFTDGSARSAAQWRSAITELDRAGKLEREAENIYRVTASGYALADSSGSQSEGSPSAFNQSHETHIRNTVDSLTSTQRDFLRLLLLKGGTVRGNVFYHAWARLPVSFEINGLVLPLEQRGLVTRTQDHREGFSTVIVNEGASASLRKALFPRTEETEPSFVGI